MLKVKKKVTEMESQVAHQNYILLYDEEKGLAMFDWFSAKFSPLIAVLLSGKEVIWNTFRSKA